jgi:serine/threonine protein kinase
MQQPFKVGRISRVFHSNGNQILKKSIKNLLFNEFACLNVLNLNSKLPRIAPIGYHYTTNNESDTLLIERIDGISLKELFLHFHKPNVGIPLRLKHYLFTGCMKSLKNLHSQGCAHGNLDPTNIILQICDDSRKLDIKFIDFHYGRTDASKSDFYLDFDQLRQNFGKLMI